MSNLNRIIWLLIDLTVIMFGLIACNTSSPITSTVESRPVSTAENPPLVTAVPSPLPVPSTPLPTQIPTPTMSVAPTIIPVIPTLSVSDEITFQLLAQQGGETKAVAVADNLAYIGMGPRVITLDISDPALPEPIGQSQPLPGIVNALVAHEEIAYIGVGSSIISLDISNLQVPAILGQLDLPHPVTHLALYEDILVGGLSSFPSELHENGLGKIVTINVSQPEQLQLLDSVDLPWYVNALALADETVYASNPNDETFYAVKINTPANLPEPVSFSGIPLSYSLQAQDQTLYIGGGRSDITALDVSNLLNPQKQWEVLVEPGPDLVPGVVKGFVFSGNYAYLDAAAYDGATRGPVALELPETIENASTNLTSNGIVAENNHLLITDDGLQIYSISDAPNILLTGEYSQPVVWDVAAVNDMGVFVEGVWPPGNRGGYLYTINLPNLSVVGQYEDTGECEDCYSSFIELMTQEEMTYVSASDGLRIISLEDTTVPRLSGSLSVTNQFGLLAGSLAENGWWYTADTANCNDRNLLVYDLTDPQAPQQIADAPVEGCIRSVIVNNDILYVATIYADRAGGAVHLFDVSAAEPKLLATIILPATVYDVQTADNVAIASTSEGITVISTIDPKNPHIMADLLISGGMYEMVMKDNIALATTAEENGNGRLLAIDLSQPSAPRLISLFDLPTTKGEIALTEEYVLIGNPEVGLLALQIQR